MWLNLACHRSHMTDTPIYDQVVALLNQKTTTKPSPTPKAMPRRSPVRQKRTTGKP